MLLKKGQMKFIKPIEPPEVHNLGEQTKAIGLIRSSYKKGTPVYWKYIALQEHIDENCRLARYFSGL